MVRKLKTNPLVIPFLLITLISMLAYLPLIPFLGFYSEDILYSYAGHFYGPQGIIDCFSIDRPFTGYLLAAIYSILGDRVILWHVCMFFLKITGGYLLFFFLLKLWPNNTLRNRLWVITSVTVMFLVYPGFLQQTLPVGYIIYGPIPWLFWMGSVIFNLLAIQSRNSFKLIFFTVIAVFLQIITFLNIEFYIGLEVLRFFLLLYILKIDILKIRKTNFSQIKKILMNWAPYLAGIIVFLIWRVFIFKSNYNISDFNWIGKNFYSNPLWLAKIPLEIIYSWIQTVIFAFFLPILLRISRISIAGTLVSLFVGIFVFLVLFYFYKIIDKPESDEKWQEPLKTKIFGKRLFLVGLISIVGALIPIILVGRLVRLFNVLDRYTITNMLSVAFLFVGISLFKLSAKKRHFFLILLIALSVTTHLMNGFLFAANWDKQRNIWWQLYWRAPQIENNAMLIFDFPPLEKKGLFNEIINKVKWQRIYWITEQVWTTGNLFFNYENPPKYNFFGDFLPDIGITDKIKNKTIEQYRYFSTSIILNKNYNNTVIISTPNDKSCLWILDKTREELPENANNLLKSNVPYSDTDKLVQHDIPVTPPASIFGTELPHTWCYYFQKASLYRQLKDWNKVSRLTEEVLMLHLKPEDTNEWLPFIEGLIVSKKYLQAMDLINLAYKNGNNSDTFTNNVCKMTQRLHAKEIKINCT